MPFRSFTNIKEIPFWSSMPNWAEMWRYTGLTAEGHPARRNVALRMGGFMFHSLALKKSVLRQTMQEEQNKEWLRNWQRFHKTCQGRRTTTTKPEIMVLCKGDPSWVAQNHRKTWLRPLERIPRKMTSGKLTHFIKSGKMSCYKPHVVFSQPHN